MSIRTKRIKAVRLAWERERSLVSEGTGTRNWTEEQQKSILEIGLAFDDDGKAFEGQHMKSVNAYPEYADNPDDIQFLTREEHLEAHEGSWNNPTNWYYDPTTKQKIIFGENELIPCPIIELNNPVAIQKVSLTDEQIVSDNTIDKRPSTKNIDEINNHSPTSGNYGSLHTSDANSYVSNSDEGIQKAAQVLKDVLGKTAKWIWQNKGKIAAGTLVLIKFGTDVATASNGSDTKKSNNEISPPSQDTSNECGGNGEESNNDIEKGTHASPREHMVKAHGEHYGKNKIWIEKEAYPRGGKNKNED